MTKRELRRMCIQAAMGMANQTPECREVYDRLGYFGLIAWRTRDLERMFSHLLKEVTP